jgi:acyl-CoA synthetase (AMP-forming)/AMP-acid ligase II
VTMSDPFTFDLAAVPIGRALGNARLYVVDAGGSLLPAGVPGELWIGGGSLARGYSGRAALTAKRFTPDPFSGQAGARVYRTGDMVKWRGDGQLEFLGRFDEQVKLRGFRIELGEIEAALAAQPGVRQAAVLLREDAPVRRQLLGYLASDSIDEAALRERLSALLPEHCVPSALLALPLTAHGKIDRKALPAPVRSTDSELLTPPTTATERILTKVWQQVLGCRSVKSAAPPCQYR